MARQAVTVYFDPEKEPKGVILDSILVVPGSHGRLENISAAGTYLQDEEFWLGNQLVQRKAGEKAGNHMAQWRKAREEHPELFQNLRLWSQPAAMVDASEVAVRA